MLSPDGTKVAYTADPKKSKIFAKKKDEKPADDKAAAKKPEDDADGEETPDTETPEAVEGQPAELCRPGRLVSRSRRKARSRPNSPAGPTPSRC